jgi:hypothetical protein
MRDDGWMPSAANRRYPRIVTEQLGAMEIRVVTKGKVDSRVRVPISIRSLSCEGAGVMLGQPIAVERGSAATVSFAVAGQRFELPSRIVWIASPTQTNRQFDLGVKFQLELAQHATRQAYAQWIVEQLMAARGTTPGRAVR